MNKDTLKGAARDVAGSVKQGLGKATGSAKLQAEGAADKVIGKTEEAIGNAKDAVNRAMNK